MCETASKGFVLSVVIVACAGRRSLNGSHRPIICNEGDWARGSVVEDRAGERASEDRTGVKIEPVVTMVGQAGFERRVAMDDIEAVVALVRPERLADPQHDVFPLFIEGNVRINASVDEESLVVTKGQRQAFEPGEVLAWDCLRTRDLIAAQRHVAAIAEPKRFVLTSGCADQHLFVIAAQTRDLLGLCPLQVDQQIDDLPTAAAAVNVVADEHEPGATASTMGMTVVQ